MGKKAEVNTLGVSIEMLEVTDVLRAVSAARTRRMVEAFLLGWFAKIQWSQHDSICATFFFFFFVIVAKEISVGVIFSTNTNFPCLYMCL